MGVARVVGSFVLALVIGAVVGIGLSYVPRGTKFVATRDWVTGREIPPTASSDSGWPFLVMEWLSADHIAFHEDALMWNIALGIVVAVMVIGAVARVRSSSLGRSSRRSEAST